MGKIVPGPMRYHRTFVMSADAIWRQPDPPDGAVYDMCATIRAGFSQDDDLRCKACPQYTHTDYGPGTPMCYALAQEACKLAHAWIKRGKS